MIGQVKLPGTRRVGTRKGAASVTEKFALDQIPTPSQAARWR